MGEEKSTENRFNSIRRLMGVVAVLILAASGLGVLTSFSINKIAASGDYAAFLLQWNQHHCQAGMWIIPFIWIAV